MLVEFHLLWGIRWFFLVFDTLQLASEFFGSSGFCIELVFFLLEKLAWALKIGQCFRFLVNLAIHRLVWVKGLSWRLWHGTFALLRSNWFVQDISQWILHLEVSWLNWLLLQTVGCLSFIVSRRVWGCYVCIQLNCCFLECVGTHCTVITFTLQ